MDEPLIQRLEGKVEYALVLAAQYETMGWSDWADMCLLCAQQWEMCLEKEYSKI